MRKISWCITIKDRCKPRWKHQQTGEVIELPLLSVCLNSLIQRQQEDEHWEICISDWNSTDVPDVQDYLNTTVQKGNGSVDFKLTTLNKSEFSRGYGRNAAFKLSTFDTIFFLDADMLFKGRQVIDNAYTHCRSNNVYFPVCISFRDAAHTKGWPRVAGTGNVAISRNVFLKKPGGWMDKYSWGLEDDDMLRFFKPINCRDITKTFFHQWHPSKHNADWLINAEEWDPI